MKRFFAVVTALMLLFLCGCENVTYQDQTSVDSNDDDNVSVDIFEQLEQQLPDLSIPPQENQSNPDGTGHSRKFVIATNDSSVFYESENTAGTISKAIEDRNNFLRDKYDVDIVVEQYDDNSLFEKLVYAKQSGLDICDMISVSAETSVKLYAAGLLMDMNTLPNFNLESDFFDQNLGKSLATNNSLYLLADPSTLIYEDTFAMYFNRELIRNSGAEDPETLVREGKWTWDKFYECAKTAAPDVYKQSSSDIARDTYGFAAYYTDGIYPMVMFTSTGNHTVANTYKNNITLNMKADDVSNICIKLRDYFNSKGTIPTYGDDASQAFQDGRVVFFCNTLEYLSALRNGTTRGDQYGILPIPKYTEEQDRYYCLASTKARVISVPVTSADNSQASLEFVNAMISAICATGGATMRDAYIDANIALYLNNNTEALLFRTVVDSVVFDFATVFGSGIVDIDLATSGAICDYIDFGSKVTTSIRNGKPKFEAYVKNNFS